jgi:outer membrane protein assembly factor BamB
VWPRGADGDGIVVAVVGREESDLVALGTDGDERWSFTTDGRPNPTATVGSRVYLGTDDGFLVALDG